LKQKTIFEKANDLGNYLAKITIIVVIILAAVMVLTVLVGIFFRYVLFSSLSWSEELARYLMIWAALLSISIGIKDKEHVGIQLIIRNIPIKYARIVNFLVNIIILIFLGVLSYKGMYVTIKAIPQLSLGLGISMFWALLSIPVSGALAIIQQIIQIIISFKSDITFNELLGETEVEEALKEVSV
jgi:TRAP-type C4-dicarboxylate transport system permease small subunit